MVSNDNLDDLIDNWPFDQIYPDSDEAIYDILVALSKQYDTVDTELTTLEEQRRLDTATGTELDKLAAEVGVARETGESDDRLRFRALIAKAGTRFDGTFPSLAEVLFVIFGSDVSNLSVGVDATSPTIQITAPQSMIDDTPLTRAELANELVQIVPAGDDLQVLTNDVMRLGQSGSQGLGNGELV